MFLSLFVLAVLLIIVPLAARHWPYVRTWLRVAWVCRVSVTSAGLGLLMMSCVPQAQDVFLETDTDWYLWLVFAAALLLWAIPVHYSARRILEKTFWARSFFDAATAAGRLEDRLTAIRRSHQHAIEHLPRILGAVPFVAVGVGLVMAYLNLRSYAGLDASREAVPQLFWLAAGTGAAALAYAVYVFRRAKHEVRSGARGLNEDSILFTHTQDGLDHGVKRRAGARSGEGLMDRAMEGTSRALQRALAPDVRALLLAGLSLALFFFAILAPFTLTDHVLSRATFLCVMLGIWVLPLTFVAMAAHRVRAPLILVLFGIFSVVSWVVARQHDVRTLPREANRPAEGRQITINEAVTAWMSANDCAGRAMDCPAPIIVAAQGGASRAAFFTNTVLGDLLDRTRAGDGPARYRDFGRQLFALSSVSGSSLGAVVARAALDDAGGPEDPAWARGPCRSSDRLWFGFNRLRTGDGPARAPDTWTTCLQTLTAGDFLSPVFVGLAFRDWTAVPADLHGSPLWLDRSALLETAFERFYARHVALKAHEIRPGGTAAGLERRFGYPTPSADHWKPLLLLNGTSVETGRRLLASELKPWHKLDTIYSPLIREDGACTQTLFSEAYDLFELLAANKTAEAEKVAGRDGACWPAPDRDTEAAAGAPDIALSTAVLVSARFPLISTDGIIRDRSGTNIVDRVVDGGYFENDGLITASEVANTLAKVCTFDRGSTGCLKPVIVRITNEPDAALAESWRRIRPASSPPLPDAADRDLFGSFLAPLRGLYNTRSGHGAEAALTALRTVESRDPPARFIRIAVKQRLQLDRRSDACRELLGQASRALYVRIENPKISMSWWLSQPVQAFLDCHRSDADYLKQIRAVLCHLERPVPEEERQGCGGRPRALPTQAAAGAD